MTTALTTGYQFPIPPMATGGITDGYATLMQEADDHVKGDVNTLSGIVTTLSGSLTTTSGYLTTLSGSLTTLSGTVTTLSGSLTTLSGSLTTTSGYVTTLSGNVSTLSNYITGGWTDYSGTSTIVGWSSFVTKVLKYKKVGTLVCVTFYITGTSNNVATTFTLPFASVAIIENLTRVQDNGGGFDVGLLAVAPSGSTVTFYPDLIGSGWTAANDKSVVGQFFYEVA